MDNIKPICKRCLLRELSGQDQALKIINEYKEHTSESDRATNELYEQRLSLCKSCKYLNQGTCIKKGAYVEAFCYREKEHCPVCVF